ncbi:MAG: hypothetical protein HKN87_13735 [Saprospiraceae bacterium]|nr:hypothetical protein [Saprospiraceae bacterium]
MSTYISDLHIHPSFKASYNLRSDPAINLWNAVPEKTEHFAEIPVELRPIVEETARSSQTNFNKLFEGKVRSLFLAIHPMERGWLRRRKKSPNPIRHAILKKVLKNKHMPHIAAGLSGIPIEEIRAMQAIIKNNGPIDYYLEDTLPEYEMIRANEMVTGDQGARFQLVSNWAEYQDVIKNKPNTLAGILTIEGGHAISSLYSADAYQQTYLELTKEQQNQVGKAYLKNIKRIKGLLKTKSFAKQHTPFFISLVHMYNNFLAGHAKSYKDGIGIFPGMDDFLDQSTAMNDDISPLGFEVIQKLLHKDANQRRILIDVKHMSLAARKTYYQLVSGARDHGDPIPIIYSHGSVNGFTENKFFGYDDNANDKHGYLSHWSINLYDEDIRHIYASDGLIGLAPHEGRMPGGEALALFNQIKKAIDWDNHRKEAYLLLQRNEYIKLFLSNVFHIVKTINKKSAWNHISLGSDYDGIMNPFDCYPDASFFMRFFGDVKKFLDDSTEEIVGYENGNRVTISHAERKHLMFNLSSKKIIEKLAFENMDKFLEKYFTQEYLGGPASFT